MRSRAVSFPVLCSRSRRSGPPPASASSEMRRSSSMRSRCLASGSKLRLGSDNGASLGRRFSWRKNAHSEMRGEPDGSEKQYDAEEQFRSHGHGALQRRIQGGHIFRGLNKHKHGSEGHRHDEDSCKNGSENHFHGTRIEPPRIGKERITQPDAKQNAEDGGLA